MSDYIEVTVRVPADLEVSECLNASNKRLWSGDTAFTFAAKPGAGSWTCDLGRQIAAAVEARKPKPTKFGVGDVVEWEGGAGKVRHTEVLPNGKEAVWLNDRGASFLADALTLVRRAEK